MIVFYSKKEGNIVGVVEGRIHNEAHSKIMIGDPKEVDKLVINWLQIEGTQDYTPNVTEDKKQMIIDIDKDPSSISKYKIDLKTKSLVLI